MRSLSRDILPLAVAGGLIAVAVIAPVPPTRLPA